MIRARSRPKSVATADAVIVGAGFAGVATAQALVERGLKRVVVLEKEGVPGLHSSGRNASMVRQVVSDPDIAKLSVAGAAAIREIAAKVDPSGEAGFFRQSGSLLLAAGDRVAALKRDTERAAEAGVPVEWLESGATRERFDVLSTSPFDAACYCANDGVVDIFALLRYFLATSRSLGAEVHYDAPVTEILTRDGGIKGLRAGNIEIETPLVINAAGGWAAEIASLAGASPLPLSATRRHVFVSEHVETVSPNLPFIWDLSAEVYFRPQSGGLLLSPCDETTCEGDLNSRACEERSVGLLREKVKARFPALPPFQIRRGWSGIRTLTPDGRFAIGADPEIEGFFWVAGIGGHGVTTAPAMGRLAAELILSPGNDADNPHRPGRFAIAR